jgi:hypothetical protein
LWAAVVVLPFDGAVREWRWSYKDAADTPFTLKGLRRYNAALVGQDEV